jgi:hypothetical protein
VKPPRVQISTLMIIVAFIALNLGAVHPSIIPRSGALPMANLLLAALIIGVRYRGSRRYLLGFVVFGAVALASYVAIDHLFPQVTDRYQGFGISKYLDTHRHRMTRVNQLELDALVMAMLGLPQLGVALAGAWLTSRLVPAVEGEPVVRKRALIGGAAAVLAVAASGVLWARDRARLGPSSVTTTTVFSSSFEVSGRSPAPGKIAVTAKVSDTDPGFPRKRWFTVEVRDSLGQGTVWKYAFNDVLHTTWAPAGKPVTCKLDETLPIDLLPGTYVVYVELREDARIVDRNGKILDPSMCLWGSTTEPIVVK